MITDNTAILIRQYLIAHNKHNIKDAPALSRTQKRQADRSTLNVDMHLIVNSYGRWKLFVPTPQLKGLVAMHLDNPDMRAYKQSKQSLEIYGCLSEKFLCTREQITAILRSLTRHPNQHLQDYDYYFRYSTDPKHDPAKEALYGFSQSSLSTSNDPDGDIEMVVGTESDDSSKGVFTSSSEMEPSAAALIKSQMSLGSADSQYSIEGTQIGRHESMARFYDSQPPPSDEESDVEESFAEGTEEDTGSEISLSSNRQQPHFLLSQPITQIPLPDSSGLTTVLVVDTSTQLSATSTDDKMSTETDSEIEKSKERNNELQILPDFVEQTGPITRSTGN